jgi:hypothetical protein
MMMKMMTILMMMKIMTILMMMKMMTISMMMIIMMMYDNNDDNSIDDYVDENDCESQRTVFSFILLVL